MTKKNGNKALIIIELSGKFGGAEKRYLNLFNYIGSRRNDFYLFINKRLYDTFDNNNFFQRKERIIVLDLSIRKKNIEAQNLSNTRKTSPLTIAGKSFTPIKRMIKHSILCINLLIKIYPVIKKLDIRFIYSIWVGGIWSWFLKYAGIKFVYGYMDSSYSSLNKGLLKFFSEEYYALKHADIVDCLSPKIASDIKKKIKFSSKQKIIITPNSFINSDNFYPVYPKTNSILFISRLTKVKNPILFLECLALIQKELIEYNFNAFIIGQGALSVQIQEYISSYRLKNVNYISFTMTPEKFLQRSKIFLSLQDYDNYPSQSLIEAMACENIVLATNVGNTNFLVDEGTGFLVNKNPHEISNVLRNIIIDEDKYINLAKNARLKVLREHTIERFYSHFVSLIDVRLQK